MLTQFYGMKGCKNRIKMLNLPLRSTNAIFIVKDMYQRILGRFESIVPQISPFLCLYKIDSLNLVKIFGETKVQLSIFERFSKFFGEKRSTPTF